MHALSLGESSSFSSSSLFFFFSLFFFLSFCSLACLVAYGLVFKMHGDFVVQFVCSPCFGEGDMISEDHPLAKIENKNLLPNLVPFRLGLLHEHPLN